VKFQKLLEPVMKALQNYAKSLKKAPDSLKDLAEQGWYLPFDFNPPAIVYYAEELKKGNYSLVDEVMVNLFADEINIIEKNFIEKFPSRKAPIRAAIRAHKAQDYYLSIPVYFSQTEGICPAIGYLCW
jgi:hypothetical protein